VLGFRVVDRVEQGVDAILGTQQRQGCTHVVDVDGFLQIHFGT
jgi:hypothetical protein